MIRTGNFGNMDSVENIQLVLRDNKITANPQSIELLDTSTDTVEYARSEAIAKDKFYYKPVEYTAANTFSRLDYSKEGISRDNAQVFKTAGYPQLTQVQHTAFNIGEILNLDMNAITPNDLIWVANKSNKDWDVLRITSAGIKIADLTLINDSSQLEITFTGSHNLQQDRQPHRPITLAISNSEEETLNGVYRVFCTPRPQDCDHRLHG